MPVVWKVAWIKVIEVIVGFNRWPNSSVNLTAEIHIRNVNKHKVSLTNTIGPTRRRFHSRNPKKPNQIFISNRIITHTNESNEFDCIHQSIPINSDQFRLIPVNSRRSPWDKFQEVIFNSNWMMEINIQATWVFYGYFSHLVNKEKSTFLSLCKMGRSHKIIIINSDWICMANQHGNINPNSVRVFPTLPFFFDIPADSAP